MCFYGNAHAILEHSVHKGSNPTMWYWKVGGGIDPATDPGTDPATEVTLFGLN